MLTINSQYITDKTGKKISAVIPMKEFKTLSEELEEMNLSLEVLHKLPIVFNMTTDEILNYGNVIPTAIKAEGKPNFEKLHLINQPQEDDKKPSIKSLIQC